ncbi:hypothetical protein BDN67DRAFT_1009767 [Paxillus ammoniavirescens]|nr:hypothetical protein BDN67DRAFT_1009767 [Paxillus ammoniavirescens]
MPSLRRYDCATVLPQESGRVRKLVSYRDLESDPLREDRSWGWAFVTDQPVSTAVVNLTESYSARSPAWLIKILPGPVAAQMFSFAKTPVWKDVVPSSGAAAENGDNKTKAKPTRGDADNKSNEKEDNDFSSKAQVMTLTWTGSSNLQGWHAFAIVMILILARS